MTFLPDYEVLHNPSSVFRPSRVKKVEIEPKSAYYKIRDTIPLDSINDENLAVEKVTVELAPRTWIKSGCPLFQIKHFFLFEKQ